MTRMNPIAVRWRSLADATRAKVGDSRVVSACELALGAAIVIGHNVFKVVPNEVPILFVLGLLSMRLRDGGWSAIGFKRPDSWRKLVLIALAAAALRIALGDFVIDEVTSRFWPEPTAPAGVNELAGNWRLALLYLGIVWTFAAFGEEIAYRGYLMQRAADVGGRTMIAWWISVIAIGILFGYGHYYKGPAGILDSGLAGVILGAAFLLSGRNLWACVLAHGFIDTFGIVAVYNGWDG
jgi:membrane protease YdiL (CAAX protease family)